MLCERAHTVPCSASTMNLSVLLTQLPEHDVTNSSLAEFEFFKDHLSLSVAAPYASE